MNPVLSKITGIYPYTDTTFTTTSETPDPNITGNVIVTAKIDGMCCFVRNGTIYTRQDLKRGRTPMKGWFDPSNTPEPDANGHRLGFRDLIKGDHHHKAINGDAFRVFSNGHFEWKPISEYNERTIEFVGPKVNNNRHRFTEYGFIPHGEIVLDVEWNDRVKLTEYIRTSPWEGIVIYANGKPYKTHRGHLGLEWNGADFPY